MLRNVATLCILAALATPLASAAQPPQTSQIPPAKLSALAIAERNAAARGGLQAWRSVQALTLHGKLEAGGNARVALPMPGRRDSRALPPPRPAEQIQLPFVMELKRPRKVRVEIQFSGQTALQVYDGSTGWKLRPFLNRREVEPFTEDERKAVAAQAELDGPLLDYAAKGTAIELAGTEKVDGHDAYKLKLTLKDGRTTSVWIDAGTFLESKVEGTPRRLDGKLRPVEVFYRDFRTVSGLKVPFLLETRVASTPLAGSGVRPATASEQIFVDRVEVNPRLDDALFSRANLEAAAATGKAPATTAAVKPAP